MAPRVQLKVLQEKEVPGGLEHLFAPGEAISWWVSGTNQFFWAFLIHPDGHALECYKISGFSSAVGPPSWMGASWSGAQASSSSSAGAQEPRSSDWGSWGSWNDASWSREPAAPAAQTQESSDTADEWSLPERFVTTGCERNTLTYGNIMGWTVRSGLFWDCSGEAKSVFLFLTSPPTYPNSRLSLVKSLISAGRSSLHKRQSDQNS
jgi:hypothetical protein